MANEQTAEVQELHKTVTELERQLDAARRIAMGLSTITKVENLVQEALNISLQVAEADAGSILLYDPEKDKLVFKYVVGEKADELTGMELAPDQGLAGQVFGSGQSSIAEDVSREKAHLREVGEKVGYITTNMVTVPLKSVDNEPIGVMQVLNKRGGPFDHHGVTLIEIMAAQIGAAIETARLHEEARLATVVRFIGNISHDVKNMITPTMTGAETLQLISDDCYQQFDEQLNKLAATPAEVDQIKDTMVELRELYPEMIEIILEGCDAVQQRMAEISAAVKGIVAEPHFEMTDIVPLAQRVGNLLSVQADKEGITVSIEPVGEVPTAMVDAKQIYNAIYNLIFNAMDACQQGDTITFRIQGQSEGQFPEGNYIMMECADTGSGMPEEVQAKLFTDDAISTKPMGTGLGTRIVKNVTDAHGGLVEVQSEEGVGTTIRCRMPIQQPEVPSRPQSS